MAYYTCHFFLPCVEFFTFLKRAKLVEGGWGKNSCVFKGFLTDILKKRFKERDSPNKNLFVEVIASEHPTVSLLCVRACVRALSNLCC